MKTARGFLLCTLQHICLWVVVLCSSNQARSQELEYGLGYIYGTPAAANLELNDIQGKPRSLNEFSNKVIVVNFWATWCPPCIAELPTLSALQERFGAEQVAVLGVNLGETQETVKAFINDFESPIAFTVLLAPRPQDIEGWEIKALPQSYILNLNGGVEYSALGPKDFDHPEIRKRIQALLDRAD